MPDPAPASLAEALLIIPTAKPKAAAKKAAAQKPAAQKPAARPRKAGARGAKSKVAKVKAAKRPASKRKPPAAQAAPAPVAPATPPAVTLPRLAEALVTPATSPWRATPPASAGPPASTGPAPSVTASLPPHPALATRRQLWLPADSAGAAPLPRNRAPARPPQGLVGAIGAWLKSAASLFSLGLLRRPATPRPRGPVVPRDLAPPAPPAQPLSEIDSLRAENAELRERLDALLTRLDARGGMK